VLVHAGDLTWGGSLEEVESFNAWLGTLPHKHKIVVAGNHDFSLDADVCTAEHWPYLHHNTVGGILTLSGREVVEKYLTDCSYLCGETATIQGLESTLCRINRPLRCPDTHTKWPSTLTVRSSWQTSLRRFLRLPTCS